MKRSLSLLLAALTAAVPAAAFGQFETPPPPPPIFDPRPGPWLVFFEPGSAEFLGGDRRVIETATASWGKVENYGLLLCYADGVLREGVDIARMRAVASALREAGSHFVVADNGWLCEQLRPVRERLALRYELPPGSVLIYGLWDMRP